MRTAHRITAITATLFLASAGLAACITSPTPEPVIEETVTEDEVKPDPTPTEEVEIEKDEVEPTENTSSAGISALPSPAWQGTLLTDGNKIATSPSVQFWIPGTSGVSSCQWSPAELTEGGAQVSSLFIVGMGQDVEPYLVYTTKVAASGLTAASYETGVRSFTPGSCALGNPVGVAMDDLAVHSVVGVSENVVALMDDHSDAKTVGVDVHSGKVIWQHEGVGQSEVFEPGHTAGRMLADFVKFYKSGSANETTIIDVETGRSAAIPGEPLVTRFDDEAFLAAANQRTDVVYLDGRIISVGEDSLAHATLDNGGDSVKGHLLSSRGQFPVLKSDGTKVFASLSAPKVGQRSRILYVDAQGKVASVFSDEQTNELEPEIAGSYGNALQIIVRGNVPVTIDMAGNELPDANPGFVGVAQRTAKGKTWILWNSDDKQSWQVTTLD